MEAKVQQRVRVQREPPRNPLRRIAELRPPVDAQAARLREKLERLDALRGSTTFAGEAAAADRVSAPIRARLEAIDGQHPISRSAVLCDDCARLLAFAISDPLDEDGLRGMRIWGGAEKTCDRCWRTMRDER